MITLPDGKAIVFFDGECNLCNSAVQFIIRHDKKKLFLFAPLQSDAGKQATTDLSTMFQKLPDSIILYYRNSYFVRSAAALNIARLLGGFWQFLFIAMIIPRFMRDGIYNFVARKRYQWFGKRNECMLPTPGLMSRFLSK